MSRIEDGGAVEAGLVERIKELEQHCVRLGQGGAERYWEGRYRDEAADNTALRAEITRLRAENAGMREVVAPFAALAKRMLDKEIPRHIQDDEGTQVLGSGVAYEDPDAVVVTVGDLRRAALSKASQAEGQTR